MLEISSLTKVFAKGTANEHSALNNLSLTVNDGDFITIIGSNGAGKSTLFNAICGTFMPDHGKIVLNGQDITFLPEHKRAKMIGRVFQDPMLGTAPHMTIEENLALAYTRANNRPFRQALNRKQAVLFRDALARYNMGLEDRMNTRVGLLSGGQRQVVTMLMCTLVTPQLLLLDEHTAALDPATAEKIMQITNELVAERHITTLMITHNIRSALTTGNRMIMLDAGEVILSLDEEQRKGMETKDLMDLYAARKVKELDNDRMLFSM